MSHFGGPLASLRYVASYRSDAAHPRWRRFAEIALLYVLRGIGPGYYLQARWSRRSIPFADKWNHVNRGEYRRFVERVNPPLYRKASQHKLLEKSVLGQLRVPTPAFVAFVHPAAGRGKDGRALRNAADLERLLGAFVSRRICFKPVEGHGGAGFAAYDVVTNDGGLALRDPHSVQTISLEAWWNGHVEDPDGYVIEEYLTQHPAMAALNASSVNTLRVWVYEKDGAYTVPGAYLRVGRAGRQIDNVAAGGLCGPIDVTTGRVREAIDTTRGCVEHRHHPDSGAALEGFEIPFWQEVVELAGRALSAFPKLRFAGADIAISPDGPCIIELNVVPDYIGCARMDLPLKRLTREL